MSLFAPRSSESRVLSSASFWDDWAAGGVDLTVNGVHIGTKTALQLSIVKGCVRILAGAMMGLPWDAHRQPQNGPSTPVRSALLERPSGVMLPSAHKWQTVVALTVWANATHLVVAEDAAGYPTRVELLDPEQVTNSTIDGRTRWFYKSGELPADKVINVPFQPLPGDRVGTPPLKNQGYVELAALAQQFGIGWFKEGAHPSAILYAEDPNLTPTQAARIKRSFLSAIGRSREPAVMGSGIKYERIQVAANESQFLETVRQAQVDICMVFGVQPEQLGISSGGTGITYANRESRVQEFLTFGGLNPLIVTLQEAYSDMLPNGQVMRVNTGALLRSDTKTRYESYEIGQRIGVLTTDEIRELEDRPPLPGTPEEVQNDD